MARPARYEHHLVVCATVDGVQLEVTTASEPLYFNHINLSDEYAIALPTGDELVDRFPLRTFLSDPVTGEDVGRYNHRVGDLVLDPDGLLHWPGRLRPPYDPFDFPPGMRRCGLSLVYCASKPTPPTWCPLPRPVGREEDAKSYVSPAPPMVLASTRGVPGVLAHIGRTTLSLLEVPEAIDHRTAGGSWSSRRPPGARTPPAIRCDPRGQLARRRRHRARAAPRVDRGGPGRFPPSWSEVAAAPFAPYEEDEPGLLPFDVPGEDEPLHIEEVSPALVAIDIGDVKAEVPRYWAARMLHRVALHGLRVGYAETYGGFFVDDRDVMVRIGVRGGKDTKPAFVEVSRERAPETIERMYRAVAPPGYRERPT